MVYLFSISNTILAANATTYFELKDLLFILIGAAGFAWGVYNFRQNQILKRQEIILPLIKEFDESENLSHAKKILDGFVLERQEEWNANYNYGPSNLGIILRYLYDKDKVIDKGEISIRGSFDSLLDFFGKLGYLMDINVITIKEINYFVYFINKALANPHVISYALNYDFQMFAVLLGKLGLLPEQLYPLLKEHYKLINLQRRWKYEIRFRNVSKNLAKD